MATPKQVVLEALRALPEDASFEDIEYTLFVRSRIEEGLRAVAEGRVVPHEQVKQQLAEWRRQDR